MAPLEELKHLEAQIADAPGIEALRPIYERLDELARLHSGDFEVQLVVADLREHLVHRGVALRRLTGNGSPVAITTAEPLEVPPPKKPINIRRAIAIGAGIGVVGWLILFVTLVQIARNRNITPAAPVTQAASSPPAAGTVPVDIITTPPGAAIQINNDTKCTSNCRVNLVPGNYQLTAMLDGYDPAATGVTVVPGAPINVTLTLLNQAQTVRIFTDLPSGKVLLDGNPAPDLTDGQLVLDRVKNGKHKLTVIGPNNEASFNFDLVAGKPPAIEGPISANNLLAVLIGSFGNTAHVQSNTTPVKLSFNGQPQGEIGPAGLDLKNVTPGDHQLSVGEGPEERKIVVSFGPMPALTAYLKSDINSGTLVVSTGEDDVTVYLNGKEYRRKTRRGQLRIPFVGPVRVRVAKEGFQAEGEQAADVKKGEEARLAFKLRPMPQVASLQVRGAAPGTSVTIDDNPVGRVAADGTLSIANLTPGDRTIELRRDGFVPRRIARTFRAGETMVLGPAETAMAVASGTLHLVLSPPDAQVTYRRTDEQQSHPARDATLKLDAGNYIFTVKAPGHLERTERIPVVAGETRNVELALAREKVEAAKPKTPVIATTGTNDWSGWRNEDGEYVRKGGNRVPVHTGPLNGTFSFTARLKGGGIFRGPKLRCFIDDGQSIQQIEIDRKKAEQVQIEVTPDRIIQRARIDDKWVVIGTSAGRTIPNGRFGFIIPGNDELIISNFRFTPK